MSEFMTLGSEVTNGATVFGDSSDARARTSGRLLNPMNPMNRERIGIELSSMADRLGAAEGAGSAAGCDNGWDEHFDETYQRSFFVHRKSGRTSWTVKHDDDLSSETGDNGSSSSASSSTDYSEQEGL